VLPSIIDISRDNTRQNRNVTHLSPSASSWGKACSDACLFANENYALSSWQGNGWLPGVAAL